MSEVDAPSDSAGALVVIAAAALLLNGALVIELASLVVAGVLVLTIMEVEALVVAAGVIAPG
jgi:hypothetical protein